ncbi:TPA: hypothetical protein KZS50_003732 [Escherichia coli]|uniref:hypothetical protein n=2 Tax=Escherichia coli TaxID=562 RepID=UPI00038FB6F1|nr:hypothetical protein [Escherichia coli]AUZ94140.1 hypothetical protein BXO92_24670 [Escherichia coli]EGH7042824.1 hypothetical protein [Escherichia coli]EHW2735095.1 hypothetical protein [Escherichia coli]EIN2679647.1 hypothetical protein [Escherichia coli]EIR0014476.1 hypothetical protein [Escherichia coli]
MTKKKSVFILLLCLLWAKTTMADVFTPGDQTINVNKSFGVADSGAVSGDWFKVSQLNMNTSGNISSFNSNPCYPLTFLCTGGLVSLGYNGKANYSLEITRHVATITDDAGNNYMFTLAFPDNPPVVGIYENNRAVVGRIWNTRAAIDNSFNSPPVSQQDTAKASASAQGYCGNISVGCNYAIAAYMHADSGMPYLYAKFPKNISAKSISFNDIKLLEFKLTVRNKAGDTVIPVTAKLYISGTISVPQRCYIRADKNSFDFGTVYSNANNGSVKNVSTSITTDCYYAPKGTTQYLKMDAVSGGSLNDSSKVYQVASDPALGVVFNINNYSQCESNTNDRNFFKQEYLIRKVFTQQQHQTSTDTINFSLCKYGVPSVTGQKTVVLKLTSRWVVN